MEQREDGKQRELGNDEMIMYIAKKTGLTIYETEKLSTKY